MGGDAYVVLAGGPAKDLVIRGSIPGGAGGNLEVLVNGRRVYSAAVAAGALSVQAPVPSSPGSRRVELRFSRTIRLRAPDLRPAAALLSFLGLVNPS